MEARDVMTTPAITVTADTPVADLARTMLERRISALPVVGETGRLLGIVSEGDLIRHQQAGTGRRHSWWLGLFAEREMLAEAYAKSHGLTASDVMTRDVVTATESTPLDRIATLLERHRIKRVPIVRRGKVVGVVSRANLLHGLVAQKAPGRATPVRDRDLRTRLLDELAKTGVDLSYINVVVTKGSVELWGLVETDTQKRAVALAARGIKGVQRVSNNVNVMLPALRGRMAE